MASGLIKPLGTEIALTTANTVANSRCVRLLSGAGNTLISVNTVSTNVTCTFTMLANTEVFIPKNPLDTIAANASVQAVAVGFFQ